MLVILFVDAATRLESRRAGTRAASSQARAAQMLRGEMRVKRSTPPRSAPLSFSTGSRRGTLIASIRRTGQSHLNLRSQEIEQVLFLQAGLESLGLDAEFAGFVPA